MNRILKTTALPGPCLRLRRFPAPFGRELRSPLRGPPAALPREGGQALPLSTSWPLSPTATAASRLPCTVEPSILHSLHSWACGSAYADSTVQGSREAAVAQRLAAPLPGTPCEALAGGAQARPPSRDGSPRQSLRDGLTPPARRVPRRTWRRSKTNPSATPILYD